MQFQEFGLPKIDILDRWRRARQQRLSFTSPLCSLIHVAAPGWSMDDTYDSDNSDFGALEPQVILDDDDFSQGFDAEDSSSHLEVQIDHRFAPHEADDSYMSEYDESTSDTTGSSK